MKKLVLTVILLGSFNAFSASTTVPNLANDLPLFRDMQKFPNVFEEIVYNSKEEGMRGDAICAKIASKKSNEEYKVAFDRYCVSSSKYSIVGK